jgi:glycosyltransferase involved in cell wall biosynthesis
MSDRALVSVVMKTYNHAPFVAEAISSVLRQEGDFATEIIVADDASTDGTAAIVGEIAAAHPGVIRLIVSPHNVGIYENSRVAWSACRGSFIAILEGDDSWTHPGKLRAQLDYFESHPDATICGHVAEVRRDGVLVGHTPAPQRSELSFEGLLKRNFLPNCSVMYRAGVVTDLPAWIANLRMVDWPLHLLHAAGGEIGFMDMPWGIYRLHPGGSWSTLAWESQVDAIVEMYRALDGHFQHRYRALIRSCIAAHHGAAVTTRLEAGDLKGARRYFWQAARSAPRQSHLLTGLRVNIPGLDRTIRSVRQRTRPS